LSDDDLIDIVHKRSEQHRMAIAGRASVNERVGEAIAQHGERGSVVRLVRNNGAELGPATLEHLVARASRDAALANDLRGRTDIDWKSLRGEIHEASDKVLETIGQMEARVDPVTAGKVSAVVYNRMRNRAGFSSQEWKVAYNQVKALADRRQFDEKALVRFA